MRVQLRAGSRQRTVTIPAAVAERGRGIALTVLQEPFQRRTWSELAFFLTSGVVGCLGAAFLLVTLLSGTLLAVVFVGLFLIAASLRAARGMGGWHRRLARHFLAEIVAEPDPFPARPGFVGRLGSTFRDWAGWRALGYAVVKLPLVVFGVWFALSVWIEAFMCLLYSVTGDRAPVSGFGPIRSGLGVRPAGPGPLGGLHPEMLFLYGTLLFFVAPWPMRLVVYLDRQLVHLLLGPDPTVARVRTLERSRAQTVDASAAMLRRIERDLHDGTQAQLVALAMRLGQAREELAKDGGLDLDQVRLLVDQAHKGAKEAIVDLRDLARGIHPPVLDTGLDNALATLTARTAIPTDLTVSVQTRPTQAIETIAYFCVAVLLANVAQHARASRAAVSCVQHGPWLRLAVRDDGRGGAVLTGGAPPRAAWPD